MVYNILHAEKTGAKSIIEKAVNHKPKKKNKVFRGVQIYTDIQLKNGVIREVTRKNDKAVSMESRNQEDCWG